MQFDTITSSSGELGRDAEWPRIENTNVLCTFQNDALLNIVTKLSKKLYKVSKCVGHELRSKHLQFQATTPMINATVNWTLWTLTPSTPAVPNFSCSKGSALYWSNPPFLIFDIRALWRSILSTRALKCPKIKNGRLEHTVWQSVKP